jgi:gamma-glutamylcyclotransferase (GGCT)/AIG2-like uncharacterized protein YtfP
VKPLFAYGTLRRPRWRNAILGADYPAHEARVRGWRRLALTSGYLSVARDEEAQLDGVLVALDEIGWRIADAWEEVPRYTRIDVVAENGTDRCAAQLYVHADAPGADARPFESDAFAALDDAAVEAAIARFAEQMRAMRSRLP